MRRINVNVINAIYKLQILKIYLRNVSIKYIPYFIELIYKFKILCEKSH